MTHTLPIAFPSRLRSAISIGMAIVLSGCHTGAGSRNIGSPPKSSSPRASFVDVTLAAGIGYQWTIPGPRPLNLLQTIGNGCAFLDYDNDGNLDILLVGPRLALYKGDGHGHFTDTTHKTGLDAFQGHFLGCAVGDYDNDGFDDIYISGYRTGLLLHNEGGRRFADVTQKAGLKSQPWGASAAFADIDGDGLLDLYVCGYLRFGHGLGPMLCPYGGSELTACPPGAYRPERGVLHRNLGRGRFRDVTTAWGADRVSGKALGAAFADYDASGRQSLAIANDEAPEDLLQNAGRRFREVGRRSGMALLDNGAVQGGMGLDWGDYDNDGRPDLAIANFEYQAKPVYRNIGGTFVDNSSALGLAAATVRSVAFGVKWLDYDNDGWLDLAFTNGHVQDNVDRAGTGHHYRQPMQLFHNDAGRRLTDVSADAGPDLARPLVGRGLATGDFDNDGRVDLLAVDSEGTPRLLHNETARVGHWLEIRMAGTASNRDGYGAIVQAAFGGRLLTRVCHADGSFLSSSDRRVHLGLGGATKVARLLIRWPSGRTDLYRRLRVDRVITLREGSRPAGR